VRVFVRDNPSRELIHPSISQKRSASALATAIQSPLGARLRIAMGSMILARR
jgi:hypothetical protein